MRNCGLNERREKPATIELILNTKPIADTKVTTPLRVDFAVEIEIPPLEGHIPRNYEEGEAYPKEERVNGEEGAIVKEDAGPANYRRDNAKASGDRGGDEFAAVANSDDIGMFPNVKPSAKQKDGACEGVSGELRAMVREGGERKSASAEKRDKCPTGCGGYRGQVGDGTKGGCGRKGVKNTHKDIGKKKRPLELVPTKAGLSAPTLLTEKASLDAIVVFVTLPRHSSLTAAKSLTPSATFRTEVQTFAAIFEAIVKDGV